MRIVLVVSQCFLFCWLINPVTVCRSEQPADALGVVFKEDFEHGAKRWQLLDPKTWKVSQANGDHFLEITDRKSAYKPPVRSPGHIALIKDLQLESFELSFRVKSTKDTGNHRDCCVFFAFQDAQNFYYVHLGAKPDPHSGQIMIVKNEPRKAITKNTKLTNWDDDWHKVKLVRHFKSGEIKIYFDDMSKPHMKAVDTKFGSGQVGIGSFDDMNAFDDIVVKKL